jgi:ABC-type amino acid transport substrate-binding protein
MIVTIILTLVWGLVLSFSYRHYKLHGQYIKRTWGWYSGQRKQPIEEKRASLFDFTSFAAASLSILGLTVGWYTITQQNLKSSLEQQARDMTEQLTQDKRRLDQVQTAQMKPHGKPYIRLGLPGRDAQVVGDHVDLSWEYPGHNPTMTYAVQVIAKNQEKATEPNLGECQSKVETADDSSNQQTQVGGRGRCALNGKYLWRVAPRRYDQPRDVVTASAGEWSEYGSFEIYPSIQARVVATHTVLVGTTYTEDDNFSGRGDDGRARGHDIDLVELLVRGCIAQQGDETVFDGRRCDPNVDVYLMNVKDRAGHYAYQGSDQRLNIHVVPYGSIDEGLRALSRREVDVFVGSVTKAKRRERGLIFFSKGYFRFHSALYVRYNAGKVEAFSKWRTRKVSVGVIGNSTNHWLGTQLTTEGGSDNRITLVTFETFAGLERAFEGGDVDGAVVDCMLASRLADASPIGGVQGTDAWTAYLNDGDNLGYGKEELGIAMVRDVESNDVTNGTNARHFSWWSDDTKQGNGIQVAVQRALEYVLARPQVMRALQDRNGISATLQANCGVSPQLVP